MRRTWSDSSSSWMLRSSRGTLRTVADDDQLACSTAPGGPIDHGPPGAKQRGHALPANQPGDRNAAAGATRGGCLGRSEAPGVNWRG